MTIEASQGAASPTESKNAEWKSMLGHAGTLEGKDAFLAVMYVMTVIFPTLSEFNEDDQMGKQATIEDALTKVQRLRNEIESDFDAFHQGYNTDNATDALSNIKDIMSKLSGDKNFSKDFVAKIRKQLNSVMGVVTIKDGKFYSGNREIDLKTAANDVANYWHGLWTYSNPNDPNDTSSTNISPVTNALNSLSSDFSSQSSIVQAKLKLFASYDKQYKAMEDDMMTKFEKEVQAPNRAMQSAGS